MKALIKNEEKPGFILESIDIPIPKPGEVLVKVKKAAICGSDLKIYKWNNWAANVIKKLPFIPGHECSGEVVDIGTCTSRIKIGDRVSLESHIPCNKCEYCLNSLAHLCKEMIVLGHHFNGCFAEYCVIPEVSVRKLPEKFSWETGALMEAAGIGIRAAWETHAQAKKIIIIGGGPVGLFAFLGAKNLGVGGIYLLETNEFRINLAKELGARVINPLSENIMEIILSETNGYGADALIEASGSSKALAEAFLYLRKKCRVVLIGQPDTDLTIDVSRNIVFKEAYIVGLHGREIFKTWTIMESLIKNNMNIEKIITHSFEIDDYKKAFKISLSGNCGKVLFSF